MKIKSYQLILAIALAMSAVSAFITVTGLSDIYRHAGYLTVLFIAAAIETTRISSIYFISLFWKQLSKIFKAIGCTFILCACLISAIGVSGFFFSAFQDSQNQVSTLEISQNTNNALIANLQDQIKSEQENIRILQTQLNAEVDVYNNLKNNTEDGNLTRQQTNSLSRKRSIQNQIASANKEIKKLNEEIIKQTKDSGESQKQIVEAAPELARLRSISKMFGLTSEETLLHILTLLIIFCFDPFAIWLMLFSNKVRDIQSQKIEEVKEEIIVKEKPIKEKKIKKKKEKIETEIGIKKYKIEKKPLLKRILKIKPKEEVKQEVKVKTPKPKEIKKILPKKVINRKPIFSGKRKFFLKKEAFE